MNAKDAVWPFEQSCYHKKNVKRKVLDATRLMVLWRGSLSIVITSMFENLEGASRCCERRKLKCGHERTGRTKDGRQDDV